MPTQTVEKKKKHQFGGKITSIKTSWSLPLRCWQRLEASRVVQCASVPLWFTPNNIASDCPFFYWIRPALLMQKEIDKQTVLCLLLGWLNYRVNSRDGLFTTPVQVDVFTPHLHRSISIAQKIETQNSSIKQFVVFRSQERLVCQHLMRRIYVFHLNHTPMSDSALNRRLIFSRFYALLLCQLAPVS